MSQNSKAAKGYKERDMAMVSWIVAEQRRRGLIPQVSDDTNNAGPAVENSYR